MFGKKFESKDKRFLYFIKNSNVVLSHKVGLILKFINVLSIDSFDLFPKYPRLNTLETCFFKLFDV